MQLEFKKFIAKTEKGANLDTRALRAKAKSEFASIDVDDSRFGWVVRLYILRKCNDAVRQLAIKVLQSSQKGMKC